MNTDSSAGSAGFQTDETERSEFDFSATVFILKLGNL